MVQNRQAAGMFALLEKVSSYSESSGFAKSSDFVKSNFLR